MSEAIIDTLLSAVPPTLEGKSILFINGQDCPELLNRGAGAVTYQQHFYPYASQIDTTRTALWPVFEDENSSFDFVLCLAPKNIVELQGMIAASVKRLSPEGLFVMAAANDAGGKRLAKLMTQAGFEDISQDHKNKARVVSAAKKTLNQEQIDQWQAAARMQTHEATNFEDMAFQSCAGMYGYEKIDKGAALLMDTIPDDIRGAVADFGCGYGYLSHRLLKQCRKVKQLHCLDADYRAIMAIKQNMSAAQIPVSYHWTDLRRKMVKMPPLDTIIMNPPFHDGKQAQSLIGIGFIKTASLCLKKNGRLWMVANTHLPYEQALAEYFYKFEIVTTQAGFKIIRAVL
jgi:16S rRNA (guanine1207-N2)-methyltransferase